MKQIIFAIIFLATAISAKANDTIRVNKEQVKEVISEYRTTEKPQSYAIVEVNGKRYVAKLSAAEQKKLGEAKELYLVELKSYTKLVCSK